MMNTVTNPHRKGILAWIERTGNALPDPVFLFFYLILGLMFISVIASLLELGEQLSPEILSGMPEAQKARFGIGADGVVQAQSLLSGDNLQKLFVQMPQTFAHFYPLGLVLTVMLGAGVAERSGLFATAMRAAVGHAPKYLLTPFIAFIAMMGNLAADAAYVVLIPLAGMVFYAAGRHPIAGIACAFAGVSGGFSANLVMGQLDALLLGITAEAAEILVADYPINIAGNWYFIAAMMVIYIPIIWYVTDKKVEPRLGTYDASQAEAGHVNSDVSDTLSADEKKGLRHAGLAVLGVILFWAAMVFGPDTPLVNESACTGAMMAEGLCSSQAQLTPFYKSLVAAFFIVFVLCGWFYGKATGTVKDHRDLVTMMSEAMKDMGYYLVLAFAAAHFVAMFKWSNLGLILAIKGAGFIEAANLTPFAVLGIMVLFSALLNLFMGSASAKWAFLAPVIVPMLMLSGISPEMTTAAYRVGDGATNIITPLMFYFPLILIFAKRWQRDYGIGSLTAVMIPYSIAMLLFGLALTLIWVGLDLPLGGGAMVEFTMPSS